MTRQRVHRGPPWARGGPPWAEGGPSWAEGGPPWAEGGPPWAQRGPWGRPGGPWAEAGPQWSADGRPWPRPPAWWLAILVLVAQLLGALLAVDESGSHRSLDALGVLLLVVGPLALAARRRAPVVVLLVALAAALGYLARDYPFGPPLLSLAVALFGAVKRGRRWPAIAVAGVVCVAALWPGLFDADGERDPAFGAVAWTAAIVAAGELSRAQRGWVREAARSREQVVARIASDERLRIARELHDVLAHNISLINVQAGVALHLMDSQPEQVRSALTTIKAASKETLTEMRSVLGVLRDVEDVAARAPTAGLVRLPELVERMAAAGVRVTVTSEGRVRELPAALDLAAYRIVQEALTNVARHVGSVPATVVLRYGEEALEVVVEDHGPAGVAPEVAPGSGNGIAGMRERAEALGGTLVAAPRPGGGFRVAARLPFRTDGSS